MARIRTIKPEFYQDERIADLSLPAAFHFPGLWVLADRKGRLRDRPREIKALIAPLRDVDMDAILAELATAGLIVRYVVGDERYIQVSNFVQHQRPNVREPESTFPAPDSSDSTASHMQARADTCEHVRAPGEGKGTGTGMEREQEGNGTPLSAPSSLTSPLSLELSGGSDPSSWSDRFVALWNSTVKNLPQCSQLTPERARKLATRRKTHGDLEWWKRVIETADKTAFYIGQNSNQWRATIDHFIDNDTNAAKVLERGTQKVYRPR